VKASSSEKIFQEERVQGILNILAKEKRVFINDLCTTFSTSAVTIRKDLDFMEKQGLLKRTHGGAIQ